MKKFFHSLHLWLGLMSGLLVVIIAITGAIYTFHEEVESTNKFRYTTTTAENILPPSSLEKSAKTALPDKKLRAIRYLSNTKCAELVYWDIPPSYYYIVFVDPTNGAVQKVKNMDQDFFRWIMKGHFYLWLPPAIGQPVVAGATLIFLVVLVTGLIIWIPRNRKSLKNRINFRWKQNTPRTRKNYDLHVVGGMYISIFAVLFAITGLVWGYQWFANGYYKVLGGKKSTSYSQEMPAITQSNSRNNPSIDQLWQMLRKEYKNADCIELTPPLPNSTLLTARITPSNELQGKCDYRYFNTTTGKEIRPTSIYAKYNTLNTGEKIYRLNYEIHTGAILGLPGKIIAFLAALGIASLPITGVIIWWKKRKKGKSKFLHQR